MTTVNSIDDLKKAIKKGETKVKPGNSKMEKVLNLIGAAFPIYGLAATSGVAGVVASVASGSTITIAGATAAISGIALTTGQVWVIVIAAALVGLILAIKAKGIKFKKNADGSWEIEYEGHRIQNL
jgi:hypothetical protein